MLKIAIIGCGKIADSHAEQISCIPAAEIVAVCDREMLMAVQLQERFNIKRAFNDVSEMLKEARPDVVHITTPPQSHLDLGLLCLEHGCHIYVEKPFTTSATDAKKLIDAADKQKLKVCVGNDAQFTPAALEFRKLVKAGYLGSHPVHMESYYCYVMAGSYAKALLGDKDHWVRRLPGGLLHNIISHGLVRIAEFMDDQDPKVIAYGFTSPALRERSEGEIIDELRVIVADRRSTTAYFTFSSQMRPSLHQLRVFGAENGLVLDDDEQSCLKLRGGRFKSYGEKFLPALGFASQHLGNFRRNAKLFLKREFHLKGGMRNLLNAFYASIIKNTPPPIPARDILLTCRLMDMIFAQLPPNPALTRKN